MQIGTNVKMKSGFMKNKPARIIETQQRGIPCAGGCSWIKYRIGYDNPEYGESGWLSEFEIEEARNAG